MATDATTRRGRVPPARGQSGRKHWAGLTIATQDTADLLGSDLGQAVVANAATQILLRQAPQAIDTVTTVFGLSDGERAFLLAAERGQALLSAGRHRAAFHACAAPAEHNLITTDPAELAELDTYARCRVGRRRRIAARSWLCRTIGTRHSRSRWMPS